MNKIKDIIALLFGSFLLIEGRGRTFAKLPTWLAVVMALACLPLLVITAVLVVAFGMTVKTVKA
ncbi:MAG: hypothetical protein IKU34_07415 [Clostridia bacterium]|nr:hypothetical protein [Clostridia bacterium]